MPKKVRHFGREIFYTALLLTALAIAVYYAKQYFFSTPFIHYSAFGISLPAKYTIHGIDVSRYQQDIDWEMVKKMKVKDVAIGFVFIKATEGTSYVDGQYRQNLYNARANKVPVGSYHFFTPSRSGKLQAQNFIRHANIKKGDLPPVLDVEQANGSSVATVQQKVAEWLTEVENKYHVKPIIYSNASFYTTYLAGSFDDYPLWVAHYLVKDKPRISRNWLFWQHSESGLVSGIRTMVDFNVFNGDSSDFKKLLVP